DRCCRAARMTCSVRPCHRVPRHGASRLALAGGFRSLSIVSVGVVAIRLAQETPSHYSRVRNRPHPRSPAGPSAPVSADLKLCAFPILGAGRRALGQQPLVAECSARTRQWVLTSRGLWQTACDERERARPAYAERDCR